LGVPSGNRTWGRPGGRNVDSNPKRFTVDSIHDGSPNGLPRFADLRIAANSRSVNGSLTRPNHRGGEAARVTIAVVQVPPSATNAIVTPNVLQRLVISVLPKDRSPGVPAIQRVIQPACFVGSGWSWHSRSVPCPDMQSMNPAPFDFPRFFGSETKFLSFSLLLYKHPFFGFPMPPPSLLKLPKIRTR